MQSAKTRATARLKCCAWSAACARKMRFVFWKPYKSIARVPHSTTLNTFADTWEFQEVPRLGRKTTRQPVLTWHLRKRRVLQLPPYTGRRQKKTKESRWDMLEPQNEHFVRDFLRIVTLCSFKIDVLWRFLMIFLANLKICDLKIDVSCEAFANFYRMWQNATPAMEFARCHHPPQPENGTRKKHATQHVRSAASATQNDKRRSPKCCACHEAATHLLKTIRKYYACHAKRFSTRSEICGNVTKCHASHAKRGYTTFETSKRNNFANSP